MKSGYTICIPGQLGTCGSMEVFLGFAPARVLHRASFADVLNEDTGEGYQRPRSLAHSRNFKQYIKQPNASTIPLTFNLRKELSGAWRIERKNSGRAELLLNPEVRCLAQVDCQHRLGELEHEDVSLAFMSFIGLDLRSEMALFNVINSKARGLSSSLTDYHESNLLNDLAAQAPHLYIARKLNEDPASPWHRMIRYGGETCSGLRRRASLRMMQTAIHRLLKQTRGLPAGSVEDKYLLISSYWTAVKSVFRADWDNHRHSLLTKGVGLYSLMYLLADLVRNASGLVMGEDHFLARLTPLKGKIDWGTQGTFAGAGGQKGAIEVYQTLKRVVSL